MYSDPIAGAGSGAAGVALLPNTSGNTLLTVLSYTLIAVGVVVIASFVAKKIYLTK